MENRRSFIENFTYRWDEEEQRYVRAYRRDPDPSEIEGAPQHHQSAATQTVIEMEVQGVPQHQSSTTKTVSFAGTNFGLRPTVLFPRRPIGVTRPSSAPPPPRPPAPAVSSPVTVRPNTSLGQVYYTNGTVSAAEGSSSTGQRVTRSMKRTRDGEENDEAEESPRSRARWVSPSRPSRPPLPDAPDSPDPSPPASPRNSPTPIVIPDTPPPLTNIRRRLTTRPAPDRPAPPPPIRPAPDHPAPPPPTRPTPDRPAPPPPTRPAPDRPAPPPPTRPAPDRPAPPPPTRPSSPQGPPPPRPMLITLINGESRRTFTAQRSADDTEVRLTRVRDPSSVPNLPDNHTTIRLPEHSTTIRFGGGSSSSSGSSSNRRVPLPDMVPP
nr:vegetative cell wall protein gp1-like [Crassostrea gigas]